jgi:hypothetical protein
MFTTINIKPWNKSGKNYKSQSREKTDASDAINLVASSTTIKEKL